MPKNIGNNSGVRVVIKSKINFESDKKELNLHPQFWIGS
jgi:hypothetical protein